ncbi:MAG: hypothetical protein ABFC63_09285 [Thermoguttaceae bacterium]
MDCIQRYNQRLLRNALRETRLITSIDVTAARRIRVTSATWDEYWGACDFLACEIALLKAAWSALIAGRFADKLRSDFVRTYFRLLRACVDCHVRGHNVLTLLRKVVGFETIRISGDCNGSAAAIISTRHPAYLLSKLARPDAPENPKYLPLICPCGDSLETAALYWHYRRIPLTRTGGIQVFVYPPTEVCDRPSSHALIGQLFACLTPKSDPWIRERSQSLYDGVFASLVARSASPRLHLLDMACGTAKITMTLCRKAYTAYRKSFDLTLVDVVRGNRSIANAFYRNPKVFGNVLFRRDSLFEWVKKNADKPQMRFDVALLLRACDLFSRFSIDRMSYREANALIAQDKTRNLLDSHVLHPAELIENNNLGRIEHRIGRFIFKNGWTFRQFSLSDYFKAIHVVMGGQLTADESHIYVPLRVFDEDILVLPSGRSIIGQLLTMANRLVIEDADLLPCHLDRHVRQFALDGLRITDLTEQAKRRGGDRLPR